jgi:hypothetical protein
MTVGYVLLFASLLGAQQDQTPRPAKKDDRGLLQINHQYYDLAANTGGDFYFWAPGEFATARLQVPMHGDDVVLSYGAMETKKSFDIPVESGVQKMTLFAGIQRKDLALLVRPDGTVAVDGQPGVTIQLFQYMIIATVAAPTAGVWRLELDGAGTYAVTAHVKHGDNGPDFAGFEFVEPGGRPGHEGMFPVKRPIRVGESLACKVALAGSVKETELAFVTGDGSLIGTMAISAAGEGESIGRCTIPSIPFRVVVRGVDGRGMRFQRIESRLRHGEPMN